MRNRAAERAVGDNSSSSAHATAPATVAQRNPPSPQPRTNVAAAIATLIAASVTISEPYWVQPPTPASIPSSVACRQKPPSPAASKVTDSVVDSVNTWAAHSGEVATIVAAAAAPTPAATSIGRVCGPAPVGT